MYEALSKLTYNFLFISCELHNRNAGFEYSIISYSSPWP